MPTLVNTKKLEMKIAIMQPYLFPYIGYFQLINAVDKFIIYDDVTFIKQGWINRNRILGNGRAMMFTVPIRSISSYTLIKDMEIADYQRWKKKFLKTLHQYYNKARYFKNTMALIRGILEQEETHIGKLASLSIKEVCRWAGIGTEIIHSTMFYDNTHLKGQDRILDICAREKAARYINTIHGVALYSKEAFDEKGIRLDFLKSKEIVYQQSVNEFVPNLSIIDVLMFNSRESIKEILKEYELV
jgi:hypothetical protein